jgi:putative oxygen-independent coproporphyrinogen III oxidase
LSPSPVAAGCYVHVPFCVSKCRYCAFFSETSHDQMAAWSDAVLAEARLLAPSFGTFDTLYFGGGTPSVLQDDRLGALIDELRRVLRFCEGLEITIELNPGDVDRSRAKRWRAMGIVRASVGVQSFDDAALGFLGRRHDAARARAVIEDLRAGGFENLGIDLIWGLPGQPLDRTMDSLEQALSFAPDHLSCYALTLEPGTPLQRDVAAGAVGEVSDDALADEAMVLWGRLAGAGYDHYEVSSFARTRAHRSRHNVKYWSHVPYLGLGPAAHSFDGARRWANVKSVRDYVAGVCAGRRPLAFEETLTEEQMRSERIALGLRTSEGIARAWVEGSALDALAAEGLITLTDDRVIPTERGMLVADALAVVLDGT